MNEIMFILLVAITSYLAGSFPTSIIMGKLLRSIDIRNYGSGNPGGANTFRVLGWKAGIAVLVIDVFKGFAATHWFSKIALNQIPSTYLVPIQILAGFSAVLGHSFTIFAGFRGGKGIATGAGILISLFPLIIPFCGLIFFSILVLTGYVSLSSIGASISFPILTTTLYLMGKPVDSTFLVFSFFIPFFILFTHRNNIKRLLSGTEIRSVKLMIFKPKEK
ncbi:MAG: glycerol-3-phosphate 1-O-acyltransferase PlsY [Acidobacteriota bacterium]